MIDEELPPFDLPAWEPEPGSGSAEVETEVEIAVVPTVSLSTLPAGDGAEELGLVAGEGLARVDDDPGTALAAARMAALDRLVEEAERRGAVRVVSVRLAPTLTKRTAAVLAYGTAVRPR